MTHSSRFPHSSESHALSMEAESVKLDGQRVLFDKKVALLPVPLEKAEERLGRYGRAPD